MINKKETEILEFVIKNNESSSKEIFDGIKSSISYATVKRILTKLASENLLITQGKGKGTKYLISSGYELLQPINVEKYFSKEYSERILSKIF